MTNKTTNEMVPNKGTGSLVDPFFRTFQDRFNRLFSEGFGTLMEPLMEENWSIKTWAPKCDIFETETEIIVKAELPDVKKEDINVGIENNMLTIRGERKFEEETRRENYHRVERSYGEFRRSFTLPEFADPEKVSATYKDGILRVTIARKAEVKSTLPRQVEVRDA